MLPLNASKDIQLRVLKGSHVVEEWGQSPMTFKVNVSEADTELELSCEAELVNVVKRSSVRIAVHSEFRVLIPDFPRPYPGCSSPLSQFFLALLLVFPRCYPGFPLLLSQFSLAFILVFPTAKPRLDSNDCPGQQNWTEGQEGTLKCQAKGKPEPKVECSKDGDSITAGTQYPADRARAGTYLCRATNELGTAERNVTIWVQCG